MTAARRNRMLLAGTVAAVLGSGCALLEVGETLFTNKPVEVNNPLYGGAVLPPLPKPKEAVQLEITFVERPVGDPLLSGTLWEELTETGSVVTDDPLAAPKIHKSLRENGLRVAIGGSTPPRAVQSLLGTSSSVPDPSNKIYPPQRVVVPSGKSTRIPCVLEPYPGCEVRLLGTGGMPQTERYENAQCVLTVTAHRFQEGWVQLEFLPEIHHDQHAMRRTAVESPFGLEWGVRESQQVRKLYGQEFTLKLNMGEMAVLSADEGDPQSLGRLFFVGATPDAKTQRVLVIRVAEMVTASPVRARRIGNW